MDNAHEIGKRWRRAGEVFLWVVYIFWAICLFAAFLPDKPEQTAFEAYLGRQLQGRTGSHNSPQPWTPEAMDLSEQLAAGAVRE